MVLPYLPEMLHHQQLFFADETTLIVRSTALATDLYSIAALFCKKTGAKLHPEKCVAVAASPAAQNVPNGIPI